MKKPQKWVVFSFEAGNGMSNEEDDNAEDQDPAGVLDLLDGDNAAGRADTY